MTSDRAGDAELITTNGVIALANLNVQIDGLAAHATRGRLTTAQQANLIDLLLLRGQILGCPADDERATMLAEQLVHDTPTDGMSFLARARTRAMTHGFTEALADLHTAERLGSDRDTVAAEAATIFQALGRYDEALTFRRYAAGNRPDFFTLGALAVLQAERGEIAEAEQLFSEGRRRYQNASPFPVALFDFQRGQMWLAQGDLPTARDWFAAAVDRVPAYMPALGRLIEVDAVLDKRGRPSPNGGR